eukprot:6334993-Ditylum_brightwellii.AAC.1
MEDSLHEESTFVPLFPTVTSTMTAVFLRQQRKEGYSSTKESSSILSNGGGNHPFHQNDKTDIKVKDDASIGNLVAPAMVVALIMHSSGLVVEELADSCIVANGE